MQAWDDLTGEPLKPKEVTKARLMELEYARAKQVWTKIPRWQAEQEGIKVIKTRWIDINKGDNDNPNLRSRFVAKEFNTGNEEGLFAATPPLEALKYLVSQAATTTNNNDEESVIMINDVARAFFEAPVTRNVRIELPNEDKTEDDWKQDMVGKLNMSLYGTRDAAANFQKEVTKLMINIGFQPGRYNPCTFYNPKRELRSIVHGDDFVTQGPRKNMLWLKQKLEERFEIKTKIIGTQPNEVREARILNRIVRVTPQGWEYEPDQRHADIIIDTMNLGCAKDLTTPYEDEKDRDQETGDEELPTQNQTQF
jgi:hypothetical protein